MATTPAPIPMNVLEQAAYVLRVLAHPHRLRMVELLMTGRLSVGELADELDLAPNAVSQHLSNMRAHGIVEVQRDGRTAYYRVANPNAINMINCIRKHGCGTG
ncbi:MAG: metalloregulator ArsR/SmtB family transcription factor [Phycisphaeraceae bacterium]